MSNTTAQTTPTRPREHKRAHGLLLPQISNACKLDRRRYVLFYSGVMHGNVDRVKTLAYCPVMEVH